MIPILLLASLTGVRPLTELSSLASVPKEGGFVSETVFSSSLRGSEFPLAGGVERDASSSAPLTGFDKGFSVSLLCIRRNSTMFQHGHHRNGVLDATFDHSFPFR